MFKAGNDKGEDGTFYFKVQTRKNGAKSVVLGEVSLCIDDIPDFHTKPDWHGKALPLSDSKGALGEKGSLMVELCRSLGRPQIKS